MSAVAYQEEAYVKVPRKLIENKELSVKEKGLLLHLLYLMDSDYTVQISQNKIAEYLNISSRTVHTLLHALAAKGYIEIQPTTFHNGIKSENRYKLKWERFNLPR